MCNNFMEPPGVRFKTWLFISTFSFLVLQKKNWTRLRFSNQVWFHISTTHTKPKTRNCVILLLYNQ
jgi:hypothetical protein